MGLKRLAKSLGWKVFPWTDLTFRLSSGVRLCLYNRADFPILQEIFIEQSYAPFLQPLPELRTWVDLGCNCGLFSLYLEDWARQHDWRGPRKALLVDANRLALRPARVSIAKNHLQDQFHMIHGAIGPPGQTVDFYESKSTYKSSVFKLSSKEKPRRVPVANLEQECQFLGGAPDLIKVDLEGAETYLLDHWMSWVQRARYLLVEWHTPHLSGKELNERCTQAGFQLELALPPEYLKHSPESALELPIGTGLWINQKIDPAEVKSESPTQKE